MKPVFPAYSLEKGTSKSSKPFSPILKKKYRAVINKKPLLFSLATINWRFQYDSRLYLTYKEALKQIIIFFKIHHLSPLSFNKWRSSRSQSDAFNVTSQTNIKNYLNPTFLFICQDN